MNRKLLGYFAALASLSLCGAVLATPAASDDPGAGHQSFSTRCSGCHEVAANGPDKMGPNLSGVVGRHAGSLPGFHYSRAMRMAGRTWQRATLDAFLHNPQAEVPGTTMGFMGEPDAKVRANIIAYLVTAKK